MVLDGRSRGKQSNIDGDLLRQRLQTYDRTPFLEAVATFLENGPDADKIKEWANKKPELWATATSALARIAGFTEKREVQIDHTVRIAQMSDAQLELLYRQMVEQAGGSPPPSINDILTEEDVSYADTTSGAAPPKAEPE